jgi:predicted nucleotidyltransferase
MAVKSVGKGKTGTTRGASKRRAGAKGKARAARSGAARKSYGARRLPRFLRLLRGKLPELRAKYGVKTLGVFGSFVRDDATKKSDLDVLIEFEDGVRISLFGFVGIQNELSDLLGVQVDLGDKKMLRSPIKENILREVIFV